MISARNSIITQQPLLAIQAILPKEDIPIGTAMIVFFQSFGGALFLSIGQCIFNKRLIYNLEAVLPLEFNPATVLQSGATSLREIVPLDLLPSVLGAYNDALDLPTSCLLSWVLLHAFQAAGWSGCRSEERTYRLVATSE